MKVAFVGFGVALVCAGLGSTSAEACVQPEPSLTRVIPDDGAHPSNAAVLIEGPGLVVLPQNLEATIDGEPVTVVRDTSLDFGQSRAVRFEPPPAPGQAVHLWGNACDLEVLKCYVYVDVLYVAEDPDLDPPPPPADLSFDITRYLGLPFPKGALSCDEPDVRARFDVSLEGVDGLMARVVLSHPDEGDLSLEVGPAGGDLLLRSKDGAEQEPKAPLRGWSLSVQLLDAAGNVSETVEVDEACLWTEGTVHPRGAASSSPSQVGRATTARPVAPRVVTLGKKPTGTTRTAPARMMTGHRGRPPSTRAPRARASRAPALTNRELNSPLSPVEGALVRPNQAERRSISGCAWSGGYGRGDAGVAGGDRACGSSARAGRVRTRACSPGVVITAWSW